ncbi:MAG TPA: saccharopine dehydrogenase [Marmoricola sp.]|nr:saccharopine dehydrogenase [Marmoricola sp.]
MSSTHFWIRHEARPTERRTPVVPDDVRHLVEAGITVTVEESPQRVFTIEEYAAAGAAVAPSGSWTDAPDDVYVVGIKELPDEPGELRHKHIYFAHAFKGQSDAELTLDRFRKGGGQLFDIEYLTDDNGKRVVAFGFWAGYVGAALGVLHLADALTPPLHPMEKSELDEAIAVAGRSGARALLALVTGARGRSGRGAQQALATAGVPVTKWDRKETRDLHKQALLGHDMLVNCVVTRVPATPFVEEADFDHERRLRVLADVTCDVTGPTNMLPVNTAITTWAEPARRLHDGGPEAAPLDVIAIDNLPSLLPREASVGFSADLTPYLLLLAEPGGPQGAWKAAAHSFERALAGEE